ncbi:ABC transporter permease [Bacillus sp. SD088]|uniref:ABC transporter permease n=1 Tax=Bacillus sp. SD088 TaxID=2782012 RepID=UPI001A96CEE8|nr:ABC transporter permease [Bacillus sp. SD088]MBO0994887.1 ABC transporter permease subunit [Bacillus sp. SD088]
MSRFFRLVFNEEFKVYIRKSTWIMYIFMAVIIIGLGVMTKTVGDLEDKYQQDNWREVMQDENKQLEKENEEYQKKLEENEDAFIVGPDMSRVAKNNYYLENDIQPTQYGAWQFVKDNELLLSLVSLFTIIVAAGIVAQEFRWGTIKLLLIRPISRTQILLSKYISVLLFALLTLLFVFIFSWIIGALIFGVEGLNPEIIVPTDIFSDNPDFTHLNVIKEIASGYGFKIVNLVMMATFAFMISAVFRNGTLAIGVAVFLMFTGNSIVAFFSKYSWSKYILFSNTNLKPYFENGGSPIAEGMSLGFSITILIVYYVVFLLLSWIFFAKRDVAGQ